MILASKISEGTYLYEVKDIVDTYLFSLFSLSAGSAVDLDVEIPKTDPKSWLNFPCLAGGGSGCDATEVGCSAVARFSISVKISLTVSSSKVKLCLNHLSTNVHLSKW